MFDYYGPLDWRRDDLLFARVNQYQATGDRPLSDFVLIKEPKDRIPEKRTEEDVLAMLGYREDD